MHKVYILLKGNVLAMCFSYIHFTKRRQPYTKGSNSWNKYIVSVQRYNYMYSNWIVLIKLQISLRNLLSRSVRTRGMSWDNFGKINWYKTVTKWPLTASGDTFLHISTKPFEARSPKLVSLSVVTHGMSSGNFGQFKLNTTVTKRPLTASGDTFLLMSTKPFNARSPKLVRWSVIIFCIS